MNEWAAKQVPFLFIVDFEMRKPVLYRLDQIDSSRLLYSFNGVNNFQAPPAQRTITDLKKMPLAFAEYQKKYECVRAHLAYGDSYLTNLTVKTEVATRASLRDLF